MLPVLGIGLFIGIVGALLGVGGGFILVPALVYLLRVPANVVVGTSLLQVVAMMCVTMVLHFARAGDLPVELNIGSIAQKEPPGAPAGGASIMPSGGMDMGSMQRGG